MRLIYILLIINLSNAWLFTNYHKNNIKTKKKRVVISNNKTLTNNNIIFELLEPNKSELSKEYKLSLKRNKLQLFSVMPSIKQPFKFSFWCIIFIISIYSGLQK